MNKKVKIMIVGPIDTKGRYQGGIAYIINMLLKSNVIDNSKMEVCTFDTCRISREGVDAGQLNIGNLRNAVMTIRALRKKLNDEKPDLLYFNTSRGYALIKDLIIIGLVRKPSFKTILHIHFGEAKKIIPSGTIIKTLFINLIKRNIDHIVLLSKNTKAQLSVWGIPENKMSVIYNFHNLDIQDCEIEKKLVRRHSKPVKDIIFLGSLDERKGIIDLIKATDKVTCSIKLHICGTTSNESMNNMIKEIVDNSNNIVLHGYVDGEQKRKLLLDSDILVLPSYGEGFPIVLVEALAAGCAIITTNVGAIPEVFSNSNGRIIDPGDINGLTNAIDDLCKYAQLDSISRLNRNMSKTYTIEAFYKSMAETCVEVFNEA